jgi:hypothetical protein
MNTLKELIALHEAADPSNENIPANGPVDIKDVVKYFPTQGDNAIKAFAKKGRLQFGGKTLYAADYEPGAGLKQAIRVAKAEIRDERIDVRVDMSGAGTRFRNNTTEEFEFDSQINDMEEVWMGYDTESNELMIGFDCWTSEDDFNDAWDKEFEKNFGEEFDHEDKDHEKIFNKARQEYLDNYGMLGMLVLVNDKFGARIEDMPGVKGFVRGILKMVKRQRGVIELS